MKRVSNEVCDALKPNKLGRSNTGITAPSQVAKVNDKTPPKSIAERVDQWGGRIIWSGQDQRETLEHWLASVRPSQVSVLQHGCQWIQILNAAPDSPGYSTPKESSCSRFDRSAYRPALQTIEAIIRTKNLVTAKEKQACVDSILQIAKDQGETTGKWMLFFGPENVDRYWEIIARETALGNLGCSAKVAPAKDLHLQNQGGPGGGGALCCVYVKNFSDRAEVKRVLTTLQTKHKLYVKGGFKPDVYTGLDIYSKNQWRLGPTIYTVKDVLNW
jgi:hypothetical protein